MHTILYLTKEEQPVFDALDPNRKDGWSVEIVEECYEETKDWEVRVKNFLPKGTLFTEVSDAVITCKTEEEFEKRMTQLNFNNLDYDEMLRVFFVLGTRMLSRMIRHTLENIREDEDIEGVMILSAIRANMFSANGSACVLP